MTSKGYKIGVTNEIIVQCKKSVNCKKILNKYNLTNISKLSDTLFLVKLENNENVFKFSQQLYNDQDIKLANPNFIKNREKR